MVAASFKKEKRRKERHHKQMKIVYNKLIPFKGFNAVNIFGVLFARKESNISQRTINHEKIHTKQIFELLGIFFYLWYFIEWLVRLGQYGNVHEAYRNISFEREAYGNERKTTYLKKRKLYSFLKYIKKS